MPTNVNTSNNTVVIQPTNYTVTVTNNNAGSTTNVTNPYTTVINVASLGPQGIPGIQGVAGVQGDSIFSNLGGGVFATTSSIQVTGSFTGSGSSTFTNIGPAVFSGSVTINGSDAVFASASALLQVDSTTKGFLPPRMTNAQRTAIPSSSVGLMVYCTDATEGLYIYKSTGWTFIV